MTPSLTQQAQGVTITLYSNGSFGYVPNPGFVWGTPQTFKYVVSDGNMKSKEATATFRPVQLEFEEKGSEQSKRGAASHGDRLFAEIGASYSRFDEWSKLVSILLAERDGEAS